MSDQFIDYKHIVYVHVFVKQSQLFEHLGHERLLLM